MPRRIIQRACALWIPDIHFRALFDEKPNHVQMVEKHCDAAAAFGRAEIVKLLLDRGADPSLCGKNGKSALQAAIENGFTAIAGLIRERGGRESCRH